MAHLSGRRVRFALGLAALLALLGGVLAVAYRAGDRAGDAHAASGGSIVAVTRLDGPTIPALPSAVVRTGGYAYRAPDGSLAIRLPHRPTARAESGYIPIVGTTTRAGRPPDSTVVLSDGVGQVDVRWTTLARPVGAGEQEGVVLGVVNQYRADARFVSRQEADATFHGHPARVMALRSRSGADFTALAVAYRPDHVLVLLAPSGTAFDQVAGSVTVHS